MNNKPLDGKGPIQPHVSNLPRRKPRRLLTNNRDATREVQRKALSSSSKNVSGRQSSSSSSSNKTNYLTNSQLPVLTPAFNSTITSSFQNDAFELNQNVVARETTPSLPHSLALPLPKSKGHIQPHADNIPRRKRVQMNPEQLRKKWRQEWAVSMHKQEVLKGSGVWVAFDLKDLEVCGYGKGGLYVDLDETTRQELDEYTKETEESHLGTLRYIVQVIPSQAGIDEVDIEEYGRTVKLFVSKDCRRDDGVPCVSTEQLSFVSRLVQDQYGSEAATGIQEWKERILITVPRARSTDAMALAIVACRAVGIHSIPFTKAMPLTRVHSRAPTRASSPEPLSFHTEISSFPPILPADPMTHAGAMQSPALTYLARMYDLEDLDEAWRGALSVSGLKCVNEVLESI